MKKLILTMTLISSFALADCADAYKQASYNRNKLKHAWARNAYIGMIGLSCVAIPAGIGIISTIGFVSEMKKQKLDEAFSPKHDDTYYANNFDITRNFIVRSREYVDNKNPQAWEQIQSSFDELFPKVNKIRKHHKKEPLTVDQFSKLVYSMNKNNKLCPTVKNKKGEEEIILFTNRSFIKLIAAASIDESYKLEVKETNELPTEDKKIENGNLKEEILPVNNSEGKSNDEGSSRQ